MRSRAVILALMAAALFGLSTPLAKLLLGSIDPRLLAGVFYLGSGVGLAAWRAATTLLGTRGEAALQRRDLPWLAGAIFFGGVVGPLLLLAGLSRADASTASLLLTFEGMATALIAWFVFRENVNARVGLGMVLLAVGALILAWQGGATWSGLTGVLAILGACVAWGIDNNLTRKIALADPVVIAMLKGLVAGPVNLAIGFSAGAHLPAAGTVALATLVGFLGYGVSLTLFVTALRGLGAARTGAYFATAPFIGALVAIPLNGEAPSVQLIVAGALIGFGVWLHLTERHEHGHVHEPLEHDHRHVHDEHHRHAHAPGDPPGEPHSHRHIHPAMRHAHAHTPDAHHRHAHQAGDGSRSA
jgi:drug/metabolite transporter (DMT)-like permease